MFITEEHRERFNQEARTWSRLTKTALIQQINNLELSTQIELLQKARDREGRKPLAESLRVNLNKNHGQVEAIRFGFSINGFFLDRGVGRDTKLSQVGSTKRKPKEWIDLVMEVQTEMLADIVAERFGDDIVESIKFVKK